MSDKQRVTLEFTDGDSVEAWLLWIDRTEHGDIGFDVIRVMRGDPNRYSPACVYRAALDELRRMDPVSEAP